MNEAGKEMPKYKCHKVVWALKIGGVTHATPKVVEEGREPEGSAVIIPVEKEYAPFRVDADYVQKHNPVQGGYYVVYEGGYKSFSPADAFESGYKLIPSNSRGSDTFSYVDFIDATDNENRKHVLTLRTPDWMPRKGDIVYIETKPGVTQSYGVKMLHHTPQDKMVIVDLSTEFSEEKPSKKSVLTNPAAHPLDVLLRELCFGRPANQQKLLEDIAARIESGDIPA